MGLRVVVSSGTNAAMLTLANDLRQRDEVAKVAGAADRSSTLLQVERLQADVVVCDGHPGPGLEALIVGVGDLAGSASTIPIVVTVTNADPKWLQRVIELGAAGLVVPEGGPGEVVRCLLAVCRGETVIPSAMLGPLLRGLIERNRASDVATQHLVNLTPREREVLALLHEGARNEQIGQRLSISPATARTHVQRLLTKLDVHSRSEAAALVERYGLDRLLGRLDVPDTQGGLR